jgi:hypothetical protein
MYTRTYFSEEAVRPPENYDGIAFKDSKSEECEAAAESCEAPPKENEPIQECAAGEKSGILRTILDKLPFSNLFSGSPHGAAIFEKSKKAAERFGTEEMLLIALALYLFFSKSGDKECAIMLVLLIFIA